MARADACLRSAADLKALGARHLADGDSVAAEAHFAAGVQALVTPEAVEALAAAGEMPSARQALLALRLNLALAMRRALYEMCTRWDVHAMRRARDATCTG